MARRIEKLNIIAESLKEQPGKFYPQEADISKEEDILKTFEWIKKNLGPIHILINNAGIGKPKTLLDVTTEEMQAVLNTNVLGLSIATREAVNDMIKNEIDGHIIHINSVTGHYIPKIPKHNIYPATKHAVTALTETLRYDLTAVGSKIKITVRACFKSNRRCFTFLFALQSISPGYVHTEFAYRNGYAECEDIAALLKIVPCLHGDDVANAVLYALGTPPHVQVKI